MARDWYHPHARRQQGPVDPVEGGGAASSAAPPAPVERAPRASMIERTAMPGDMQQAIRENLTRKTLFILNNSATETLRVSTQGPASTSVGFVLLPGQFYEPFVAPSNDYWLAPAGAAGCAYFVQEG